MEKNGEPVGRAWNFDAENRAAFGRNALPPLAPLPRFAADSTTREVLALVARMFPDSPGRLDDFDLPVTRKQARAALRDPRKAVGYDACPFTTLYQDFLTRHEAHFATNPRMRYPYQNLARKDRAELGVIRRRADALKARLTAETFL